jgi:hypothetical protein
MAAGVDLAPALLENDLGAEIARVVAKILVVYHRRAGGQSQFSALLDLHATSDRVQTALAYAKEHFLGAVNIRDGDDEDLEFHVAFRDARFGGCVVNTDWFSAHGCLLSCVMSLSPL